MRGGGTSQAGQAIGEGLQVDTSKYFNRVLEVNAEERWARVEPGVVLDELNAQLAPHGLRFAPDISTASRATIGGMMANNSAGARSVLLRQDHRPRAGADRRALRRQRRSISRDPSRARSPAATRSKPPAIARCSTWPAEHAAEIDRRYPKVLRRVGGYNLDEFVDPAKPSTWPRSWSAPKARWASCSKQSSPGAAAEGQGRDGDRFRRSAGSARRHAVDPGAPAVGGRGDGQVHPRQHAPERGPRSHPQRAFIEGDPGRDAVRRVLRRPQRGSAAAPDRARRQIFARASSATRYHSETDPAAQARIWSCAKPRSACRWR